MTAEEAALSEPLAIGVYGVRLSIPIDGARIGILGAGPIGLSVLVPAKAQGAGRIYVTDRIDARLAVARGAGATWAGNPDREDIVAAILEREPGGLDAVFDCCGKQEALDQAVRLLRPGGKLMVIGIPETDRVSFDVDDLRRKEISIQNVRRQVDCVEEALEGLRTRRYDVRFFVTHRYPLERAGEAFDLVADYRDGVVKAMIEV
jgi:threonine dehydrogenase-like Zn-dependent dehydrogenase